MVNSISIGQARILRGWAPLVMASNHRTSSHDGPCGNDACKNTRGLRMDTADPLRHQLRISAKRQKVRNELAQA